MANIVHRQMPAPRALPQQIHRAKARMRKPQGGGKFLVQIPGGARGGVGWWWWLWMKLIPALRGCGLHIVFVHNFRNRKPNHKAYQQKLNPKCIG